MNPQAILISTALAAFVGTVFMALVANYPFALAPGLGLNAYFAYTVVLQMGYSWQFALLAVIGTFIIIILSVKKVKGSILIGMPLFYSISEGISLGVISYVVINLITGKRKKITPLMYVLAVLFILKYIFL